MLAYGLVFRGGAHMHDYWNSTALLPLTVALGAGAQAGLDRWPAPPGRATRLLAIPALACLVLAMAAMPSDARNRLDAAAGTPELLDRAAAAAPPSGPVLAYLSPPGLAMAEPAAMASTKVSTSTLTRRLRTA